MHGELEDPFDHMQLDMDTTAPSAILPSEQVHEHLSSLRSLFLQLHPLQAGPVSACIIEIARFHTTSFPRFSFTLSSPFALSLTSPQLGNGHGHGPTATVPQPRPHSHSQSTQHTTHNTQHTKAAMIQSWDAPFLSQRCAATMRHFSRVT